MAFNKVEICGVNTSKLPVLKSAEMKKLFLAYRRETVVAGKNIHGNLRLVLSVIQRFSKRGGYVVDFF